MYDYIPYILIETSTFLTIAFEYQILYKLFKKTPVPVFIIDLIFIIIMLLMTIFNVVDLENSREL